MTREFAAAVWQEEDLFVAQCLELDIASQGESESEALTNLGEAINLHFSDPVAAAVPPVKMIRVELGAA